MVVYRFHSVGQVCCDGARPDVSPGHEHVGRGSGEVLEGGGVRGGVREGGVLEG